MKPWSFLAILEVVCACHQNQRAEGPLERAGKGLDTAAEKTGAAVKSAGKKTGETAHAAVHATGRAFKKLGDRLDGNPSQSQGDKRSDAGRAPSNPR